MLHGGGIRRAQQDQEHQEELHLCQKIKTEEKNVHRASGKKSRLSQSLNPEEEAQHHGEPKRHYKFTHSSCPRSKNGTISQKSRYIEEKLT